MVRDYEVMYIVRPDLDDEGLTAAMQSVETTFTGQGGEVVRTTPWGKRRLAYEIDHMRDGNYVLLHVRLDGGRVKEVERLLHINDNVVRHLVTLWVDTRGKDGDEEVEDGVPEGQVRERGADRVEAPGGDGESGGDEDEDGGDGGDGRDGKDGAPVAVGADADDDESVDEAGDGATAGGDEDEEDE